jgi:hypothetical protein
MRIAIARLLTLGLLAVLVAPGCSGSDDDASPRSRYVARYAEVYCQGVAPCCAANGSAHEVGACREFFQFFGQMEAKGATHFDPEAAEQCLITLELSLQSCGSGDDPGVCRRVLYGDRAPGAACQSDAECARPAEGFAICNYSSVDDAICVVTVAPAAGMPCTSQSPSERYSCSDDPALYCDYASDTCRLRVAIGGVCAAGEECVQDASCDSASGTCIAKAAIGGACASHGDCVQEAYCDNQLCSQKKAVGEACTNMSECRGYCDVGDSNVCTGGGLTLCVTSG